MSKTLRLAAVAAAVIVVGEARAATLTVTNSIPLSDAEISGTLSVARFDPTLGVLTGVSLSVTAAIAGILGLTNNSPQAATASGFISVDFELDSTALGLGASPDVTVLTSTGPVALGVGESVLFPLTSLQTISGTEAPSALFIGNGVVSVDFFTSTNFGGSGLGGAGAITAATDAGLELSVTYEFNDGGPVVVPLPASGALALGALGLLAAAARRRRGQIAT